MDNLAHTLAGLALAHAGLRRATARATATLVIGANLPDVDALVHLAGTGVDALAFRRGWTHGVLAMVVLPVLLAAGILAWDALVRRRGDDAIADGARIDWRWVLVLATLGVWSHPVLDLLNTYGVRLLMPFSERWFYGDALFIVDPWMWLVLGAGILLARRRGNARPARVAIAVITAYTVGMALSSSLGVSVVERRADGGAAARVMVGPRPLTPFSRFVVRDLGDYYETGILTFGSPPRYADTSVVPSGRRTAIAQAAARTSDGAKFLSWSRFPRFVAEPEGDSVRVRIDDLRYPAEREGDWASVVVYVR